MFPTTCVRKTEPPSETTTVPPGPGPGLPNPELLLLSHLELASVSYRGANRISLIAGRSAHLGRPRRDPVTRAANPHEGSALELISLFRKKGEKKAKRKWQTLFLGCSTKATFHRFLIFLWSLSCRTKAYKWRKTC